VEVCLVEAVLWKLRGGSCVVADIRDGTNCWQQSNELVGGVVTAKSTIVSTYSLHNVVN
jgi:hypothetical protein